MRKTTRNQKTKNQVKTSKFFRHAGLAGIVWGILVLILCFGGTAFEGQLQEGDIALQSIYAPFNFNVKGDIDEEKTEQLRLEAMAGIRQVYEVQPAQQAKPKYEKIDQLIEIIGEIQKIKEATLQEKQNQFLEKLNPSGLTLSPASMETLINETAVSDWAERLKKSLEKLLTLGILADEDKEKLEQEKTEEIIIRDPQKAEESQKPVTMVLGIDEGKSKIEPIVYDHFPESRKSRTAAIDILTQLVTSSLFYAPEETARRRKTAAETVQPIHKLIEIKKNELIISRGQKVGRKHLLMLSALEKESSLATKLENIIGVALLVGLLMGIFILYLKRYDSRLLRDFSNRVLLSVIAIITMGFAKAVTLSPYSSFLIPIPIASMLTAILLSSSIAMMMTLLLTILAATLVAQKFGLILVMVLAGLTAVYSVNRIRRRSDILKAGCWAGIAGAVGVLIVSLISGLQFKVSVNESGWGMMNGFLSAIFIMGTLPAFETLFKVTTNISLLELSDLNHPILRQLFIQAPGTYHHSLVVGNLAESACEAIGANALLARVGAYYHDIGKMEKAEYFTENQMDASSKQRHEKLSPHMSSLIIVNHIKNGIELAQQYKLPKRIIDFIPEHQGTSLIYFFYQKALQQAKDGEGVKEEDFRYPGAKPQSKETAVVLLADSVEAASRSLEDPAPARIRGLVRKMINNKFIDGQLDECDLTLRDLNAIAESFVRVLTGTFHTRVPYPEPHQERDRRDKK